MVLNGPQPSIYVMSDEQSPVADPIAAYVAGVIDTSRAIKAGPRQAKDQSIGYTIQPQVIFRNQDDNLVGTVDKWAQQHGIQAHIKQHDKSIKWGIHDRGNIKIFLQAIKPYLIVQHEVAEIMLNDILPALEAGKHTTRPGFLDVMAYVEQVRELQESDFKTQYTVEYFEELWESELSDTA